LHYHVARIKGDTIVGFKGRRYPFNGVALKLFRSGLVLGANSKGGIWYTVDAKEN
jgi:hypothetical protein